MLLADDDRQFRVAFYEVGIDHLGLTDQFDVIETGHDLFPEDA